MELKDLNINSIYPAYYEVVEEIYKAENNDALRALSAHYPGYREMYQLYVYSSLDRQEVVTDLSIPNLTEKMILDNQYPQTMTGYHTQIADQLAASKLAKQDPDLAALIHEEGNLIRVNKNGYVGYALRMPGSFVINGYVRLPTHHPFVDKDYMDLYDLIDRPPHGGITYSGDSPTKSLATSGDSVQETTCIPGYYLGFDCSHYQDCVPGYLGLSHSLYQGTYRSMNFVITEISNFIDELSALDQEGHFEEKQDMDYYKAKYGKEK